jgi:1-acyl-sn-glycerol-3-phosphate acyltransferase
MRWFRLARRALFALFVTLWTVALIWVRRRLLQKDQADALRIRRWWSRTLLRGIGVRIEQVYAPPDHACLLVANHRSAIDPILMMCHALAVPVSRAEVASWPILGRGAVMTGGILYLQRDSAGSRIGLLKSMADTIQRDGWSVIIFPEGTIHLGEGTLPYQAGSFVLAARMNIPVVPVAIEFADPQDWWIGNESFATHAIRSFGKRRVHVRVTYGPTHTSDDGKALCREAEAWTNRVLGRSG